MSLVFSAFRLLLLITLLLKLIEKYFKDLSPLQLKQFEQLRPVYEYWNERINVVSRKDIEQIYLHHILHSLAIAKLVTFKPGTMVLDVGTGGGFPGIPLAIFFPESNFHLIDSIGKKISVVDEVVNQLGLTTVLAQKCRAEEVKDKVDFVVSRAVAPAKEIVQWTSKVIKRGGVNDLQNGWILLKGGELKAEVEETGKDANILDISNWFDEEFFETKKIVYLTA